MKLKHFFFFALLLQGMTIVHATTVQKLLLKNGSELEGYIHATPRKRFHIHSRKGYHLYAWDRNKINCRP